VGLAHEAKLRRGAEADRLLQLSVEKFERALILKPDDHKVPPRVPGFFPVSDSRAQALFKWGTALLEHATTSQTLSDEQIASLLQTASVKLQQVPIFLLFDLLATRRKHARPSLMRGAGAHAEAEGFRRGVQLREGAARPLPPAARGLGLAALYPSFLFPAIAFGPFFPPSPPLPFPSA
jgi:hypothetical protein